MITAKAANDGINIRGKSATNIEVGCGMACGKDSYSVGREAASQAISGITASSLSAGIVFAPVSYQLDEMLSGIRTVVGDAPLFGASSAGEICDGTSSGSVVVMVLASPFLTVSVGLGQGVSEDWRKAVQETVGQEKLSPFFSPQSDAIYNGLTKEGRSAFAILLTPASTRNTDSHSPEILEELKGLSRGRIPFFGGTACDDRQTKGESNYVFHGDQAYRDSMVLAVFETSLKFGIAMGHGFLPTVNKATATKVRDREVLELDGKPAADVFAALHDLPRESLEGKPLFEQLLVKPFGMRNTLGQYTLFVPRRLTPQGGVLLAHPVPEGSQLFLMESFDDEIVAAGKDTLFRAMSQSGIARPAAILVCSCFLRMYLLEGRIDREISAITEIMPGVPLAGFYSAGEQGINDDHVSRHNNESIVILILGQELSYAAQVANESRILHRILESRIIEQQRLETELAEQVDFLQALIDNIPNPVFYKDPDGKYLGCNKAFEKYLDVRREEILGKDVQEIPTADFIDLHHRMDAELIQNGGSVVYESMNRPADGVAHHDIVHKALFHKTDGSLGGFVASVTDISDLKRAKEALAESEAMYRNLFENASIGMFQSTLEGKFLRINKVYAAMLGYDSTEEVIEAITDTATQIHADPRNRADMLAAMEERDWFYAEQPYLRKDGSIMIGKLAIRRVLRLDGTVAYLEGIVEDITERKRSEEALINRERELRIKAQNLMEVNTTMKVLLDTMERDQEELKERFLTNIQNQVLPYLGKLKKSPLQEDQKGYVEMAEAHLLEIASPFTQKLTSSFLNLTKKEIQIAYLVKEGKSSKEIAELLNAKQRVVEFHRENIRSKLGLKNKKGRLAMLLRSFS
ncbi:MAG: putative diguanylate cyclase YegE [Syntrophus sp. PtaU1.Bin208]|nr:MAG: putative diguanylate cyclase YegE [Syntrophus sp. PtaU1.Bin208]